MNFFHQIYKSYSFTEASINSKEKNIKLKIKPSEYFEGLVKSFVCERVCEHVYMCAHVRMCVFICPSLWKSICK